MGNNANFITEVNIVEKEEDAFFNMLPTILDNTSLIDDINDIVRRCVKIVLKYDSAWIRVRTVWMKISLNRFGEITVDTYKVLATAIEDAYVESIVSERDSVLNETFTKITPENMEMLKGV